MLGDQGFVEHHIRTLFLHDLTDYGAQGPLNLEISLLHRLPRLLGQCLKLALLLLGFLLELLQPLLKRLLAHDAPLLLKLLLLGAELLLDLACIGFEIDTIRLHLGRDILPHEGLARDPVKIHYDNLGIGSLRLRSGGGAYGETERG